MKRAWPYLMGITCFATGATANPMAAELVRVRQVPATMHVQITYCTVIATSGLSIASTTRDASPLVGDWTAISNFATNLGSGVKNVAGYQRCDCNLSAGDHRYEIQVQRSGQTFTLRANLAVATNYTGPGTQAAGGAPDGGVMPWDEPEPTEMQGLDCAVACGAPPTGMGGAGSTSPNVSTTGGANPTISSTSTTDVRATRAQTDEGGCSMTRTIHRVAMAWLALVGAALLLRRRW